VVFGSIGVESFAAAATSAALRLDLSFEGLIGGFMLYFVVMRVCDWC